MLELPKQNSEVDSMAEFFFRLKTYLLGYGKIDFEGILGVPFFMVNLTPARCVILGFFDFLQSDYHVRLTKVVPS